MCLPFWHYTDVELEDEPVVKKSEDTNMPVTNSGVGSYHNGMVFYSAQPPQGPPAQVPGIGPGGAHRYTYWPQSSQPQPAAAPAQTASSQGYPQFHPCVRYASVPPPPPYAAQNPQTTNPWIGRTTDQVNEDNRAIAESTNANTYHPLVPDDTNNGMNFWCREKDGSWTLRDPLTIREALQPGYWTIASNNRTCFIRT